MPSSDPTQGARSGSAKSWNTSAKKFIVRCDLCGSEGFSPEVLKPGFASTIERKAIKSELKAVLQPLPLNDAGRCQSCAETTTRRRALAVLDSYLVRKEKP